MEELKPMTNQGFFSYVFKLSKFKQADLLNFVQYCTLSIVPVLLLYYFIKKYGPRITYKSSSLYILGATLFSVLIFIVGIFFIDRIINFIPTLSGKYYDVINLTNISILLILCLFTIRAGYMERMSLLLTRFGNWFTLDDYIAKLFGVKELRKFNIFDNESDQWYYQEAYLKEKATAKAAGATDAKAEEMGHLIASKLQKVQEKQKNTSAAVILEKARDTKVNGGGSDASSATTLNPNISQQYATPAPLPTQGPKQNLPNYNNMYANTSNPLQNAATPGMKTTEGMYFGDGGSSEPEPANGALGGSGFSSWH
jgi:hypothetical protein